MRTEGTGFVTWVLLFDLLVILAGMALVALR